MGSPLTLVDLEMYRSEDACRQANFEHRKGKGFRCGRSRAWYLAGRGLFKCAQSAQATEPTGPTHRASLSPAPPTNPYDRPPGVNISGANTSARRWVSASMSKAASSMSCSSATSAAEWT